MELSIEPTSELNATQLYDQAIAHYRAARWPEALASLGELVSRGQSSSEIDMLIQDIKFKQRLDAAQAPLAVSAPKRRRAGAGLVFGLAGAVVVVALIGVGLALILSQPGAPIASPTIVQAAVGALPTPAPDMPTPAPSPVAGGVGTLAINFTEGTTTTASIGNVYLILDASGSMLARVGDERKIDLAQQAIVGLIERLPGETKVALRTYGRQRADDCSDVELLAPLAPLDSAGMIAQIEGIEPVNGSRTPIGSSLAAAATDLAAVSDEALVVLVSDGEESCEGDPVAVATSIRADQPNLRVSVVGFDIAPELRDRLAQIATVGGGSYYDAADMSQLAAALESAVTPRFRVLDTTGVEVGSGLVGERIDLPTGAYTITLGAAPNFLEQAVEVRDGLATLVLLSEGDGHLNADVRRDWRP